MSDEPVSNGDVSAKDTRFKAGNNANPNGRPKGSRNKFAEEFLSDFLADWQAHGAETIVAVRTEHPRDYLKVAAAILPKQVDVTVSDLEKLQDDELIQRIADLESRANALIDRIGEAQGGEAAQAEYQTATVLPSLH